METRASSHGLGVTLKRAVETASELEGAEVAMTVGPSLY